MIYINYGNNKTFGAYYIFIRDMESFILIAQRAIVEK